VENQSDENDKGAKGNKHADSCGCATGARVMTVALVLSVIFYGWKFHLNQLSFSAVMLRVVILTFLGAGIGKLVGIGIYQLKRKQTQ
jgi:hypothetical protein